MDDCNSLINLDPSYAGAYYVRGSVYEKLGDLQEALADYSKVLELDHLHVNAVFARGTCLNKMVHLLLSRVNFRRL